MAVRTTFPAVLLMAVLLSGLQLACQNISENIEVPEDVSVGTTVLRLRDLLDASVCFEEHGNGTFWSINITTGDDFGRFRGLDENLSLIVAAPLDYELSSRYNLTVELTHNGYMGVWYVNLVIVVTDVPGYPPLYDKRCETPVLPAGGSTEDYTVLSSDGFISASINGGHLIITTDIIEWHERDPNVVDNFVVMGDDCSSRLLVGSRTLVGRKAFLIPWLKGFAAGRIEVPCYDKKWKRKGKITILDISLDIKLPKWAQNSGYSKDEDVQYVFSIEMNEMWSTSPYWIRCSANITLFDGPVLGEAIAKYNITGCPEGKYGLYCDKNCVCKNGARCHGFNGACECRPGWRGRACDIPWPEVVITATLGDSVVKYIGTNLTLTCLTPHIQVANMTWLYQTGNEDTGTNIIEEAVQNGSISFRPISESTNGKYTCVVKAEDGKLFNAIYVLNATQCPPNYYGKVCSQVCDCQYGGTCDRWEGCLCPPGRRGDKCEHPCAPGTFGLNCSMNCYCQNNASCDAVNGSCICAEGQSGEFCQVVFVPDNHFISDDQVLVVLLVSVLLAIVVIGCIVTGVLVKRGRRRLRSLEQTDVGSLELSVMETLSSWEVDKEDIRFEHMIGEGEFGHVVRGRLRVPEGYEVLVAAKSIRPDRMTASAVRDFRREMDILSRIHEDKVGHPNVVKFHGVVTKSDPQYLLVEYASNEDMRRYLWSIREECKTTGHTKLLQRLCFAHDVASGLSELARLKIVHRDIAARNVVISDRKVAKIADFGLSRDVYVSSAYKRTNQGGEEELLPLKWMAVESLRDGVYTCESDVWSYGVLLWEIASFGEEPRYAGGPMHPNVCTLLELLRKGVRLQQPENCSQPLYRIIRSCWIVDPSKRPTPEELCQKIDQLGPPRHAAHLVNHDLR
ncbi:receptor tyrosine-protein kinase let-23-like [Branchiostoma floridae]|uniref:receptor protein-tyrosine kinase n=1 Tax=Branchiostoma floridae TaxID=7739 RepID=A0A9J7KZW3_BRAFL|nr:receptor tyrosine-protein kinase let-23-like [Branchiostoma floridae]